MWRFIKADECANVSWKYEAIKSFVKTRDRCWYCIAFCHCIELASGVLKVIRRDDVQFLRQFYFISPQEIGTYRPFKTLSRFLNETL